MGHLKRKKSPNSLKILKTWTPPPPVPGVLTDPIILMCTQCWDISDSGHSSTSQGFIVFGTKTLKLPFASGKTLPQRFPTYRVCAREEEIAGTPQWSWIILSSQLGNFFLQFLCKKYCCLCIVDTQIQEWNSSEILKEKQPVWVACSVDDANLDWLEWLHTRGTTRQKAQPNNDSAVHSCSWGIQICSPRLSSPVFWAGDGTHF